MTAARASSFVEVRGDDVVWLDQAQMVEVDRVMIDELRIELIQMMENAGRNLAHLALQRFAPRNVTVFAGTGGNGGGGLVAARHLHNSGVDVAVILSQPADRFVGVPEHQLDILQRMGVTVVADVDANAEVPSTDLFIDALIGYSLNGAPRGKVRDLIHHVNGRDTKVLALDVPTGLDSTDGSNPGDVVSADATMTLALPKIGLKNSAEAGELFLADISVPRSVYQGMGLEVPALFSTGPIVRIS